MQKKQNLKIKMNEVYINKDNCLIFPFKILKGVNSSKSIVCYATVYPINDIKIQDIMQMIYLNEDGLNAYNDIHSAVDIVETSSEIYKENKDFIEKVKQLLQDYNFRHFYYNAIIFPRSIFDANTKTK